MDKLFNLGLLKEVSQLVFQWSAVIPKAEISGSSVLDRRGHELLIWMRSPQAPDDIVRRLTEDNEVLLRGESMPSRSVSWEKSDNESRMIINQ